MFAAVFSFPWKLATLVLSILVEVVNILSKKSGK